MKKNNFFSSPIFYVAVVLYVFWGFATIGMGNQIASYLFSEDHYFENVGAISLFAASFMMFYAFFHAVKNRSLTKMSWIKQLAYLGLAILFLFGAGEEISWGQRIFGIETPAGLQEINKQDEITVHNIVIDGQDIPFEFGFDVFWGLYIVLIPLVLLFSVPLRNFASKFLPIVYWGLGSLFIINYLTAKVAFRLFSETYKFNGVPLIQAVQEVKESNYEFFYALVCLYLLWDLFKFSDQTASQLEATGA
jgi:hypothetical protein